MKKNKKLKQYATYIALVVTWLWIFLLSYGVMTIIDYRDICNMTAQSDWKYPLMGIILLCCLILAITATVKKGKLLLLLPLVFLLPYLSYVLPYSKEPVSRYDKLGSVQSQERFPFCLFIEKN